MGLLISLFWSVVFMWESGYIIENGKKYCTNFYPKTLFNLCNFSTKNA